MRLFYTLTGGILMPNQQIQFEIDDTLSTAANIAAFAEKMKAIDPELAAVLEPHLTTWAAGDSVDTARLWNGLMSAIEGPADEPNEQGNAA